MNKVLIVFTESLLADLGERPGRNKLEKQKAATPRIALQAVLARLSRDMQGSAGTSHLRADVLEEPVNTRAYYRPESLADLLVNFRALTRIPAKSKFAAEQPEAYLAVFHYSRLGLSLLAGYVEPGGQPCLVILRAMNDARLSGPFGKITTSASEFDSHLKIVMEAAADAIAPHS
ncbi:hypothetical protein [Neorhizobium sp. NCHU2750]|uniref:hypothetical protein n=1 Tax=Neorhizobium sp. NCHU2750 TaxID=1825976 RepID=UPI000E72392F|nr:hypothetical protein NCHU2750_24830 [Neorhizobium sp. NCHU2750]